MNELSGFIAENLANSLPMGLFVALFAWTATRILRIFGPRVRFAIWISALTAIVMLPLAGAVRDTSYRTAPTVAKGVLTLSPAIARYLVVAWIIGGALGLAHVGLGLYRLRRLRRTCEPVDVEQLAAVLRATLELAKSGRAVTLCISESVRVPAALGYLRPIVVFPKWALSEMEPEDINAILLHELAHLRRYDDWTNLVQKTTKAVFFFHPAVWFIESRLTLEREIACDDAVLAASYSPRAYAESLVSLAEKTCLRRTVQMAQAAVGHIRQLKLRLAEILRADRSKQGSTRLSKPVLASLVIAGLAAGYSAVHFPRLIAFSGNDSSNSAVIGATSSSSPPALEAINARWAVDSQPVLSKPKKRLTIRRVTTIPPQPTLPVVLVFQAQQFGPHVLWRVTVIHLTPYEQQVVSGQLSKQI